MEQGGPGQSWNSGAANQQESEWKCKSCWKSSKPTSYSMDGAGISSDLAVFLSPNPRAVALAAPRADLPLLESPNLQQLMPCPGARHWGMDWDRALISHLGAGIAVPAGSVLRGTGAVPGKQNWSWISFPQGLEQRREEPARGSRISKAVLLFPFLVKNRHGEGWKKQGMDLGWEKAG